MKSGTTIISEYIYDVLGRRTQKKVGNETITYIYSNKNILEEVRNNGIRVFKKVYVNGLGTDNLIAYEQQEPDLSITEINELNFCNDRVLSYTGSFTKYGWNDIVNRCNTLNISGSVIVENMYYFHKNHLGSVIGITDKYGNTVSEYDYDVFGKVTLTSGDDTGNTRLYTGREYDKEIGLYFLRARYYDPVTGRFISKDPIGQIDDVNLYAYVGNNSVMFVDLMGLAAKAFVAAYDDYINTQNIIQGTSLKINEIQKEVKDFNEIPSLTESALNNLIRQRNKAQESIIEKEKLAKKLHYSRNDYNTNLPKSISSARDKGWTEPTFLGLTYIGAYYHQDPNIEGSELKFVSPNGHKEIIFDIKSNKVGTDEYLGTYNFYSPSEKLLHTKYDVSPYKLWGNTPNDKIINN